MRKFQKKIIEVVELMSVAGHFKDNTRRSPNKTPT